MNKIYLVIAVTFALLAFDHFVMNVGCCWVPYTILASIFIVR